MESTETRERAAWSTIEALAAMAKALSCAVRLEVFLVLADVPACVSVIAGRLDLDPSHVSRHLGTLERHGLVSSSKDGRRHIFALTKDATTVRGHDAVTIWLRAGDGALGLSTQRDAPPSIEITPDARVALNGEALRPG